MKWKILILALAALGGWCAGAQTYDTNNEVVQTFAGYGIAGDVDAQGLLAQFSAPAQVVSDTSSNLYVWDSGNARIRKITPDGMVSTLVGGGAYFNGYGTNVCWPGATGARWSLTTPTHCGWCW